MKQIHKYFTIYKYIPQTFRTFKFLIDAQRSQVSRGKNVPIKNNFSKKMEQKKERTNL